MLVWRRQAKRIRTVQPSGFRCTSCNGKVTAKDRFCRHCGRRLKGTCGDMRQFYATAGHFNEDTGHWEGLEGYWGERKVPYVAKGDK
jgi:predicted amidophosphoribosyltransferase